MLIQSTRPTRADLDVWARLEGDDQSIAEAGSSRLLDMQTKSAAEVSAFSSTRSGYISVSWGKDSVVMLSIASAACDWPIAWIRIPRFDNPDCESVRDAFFAMTPIRNRYHEVVGVPSGRDPIVSAHRSGFAAASSMFGDAYITGLRGQESAIRLMRMKRGLSTRNTCAPIGWWTDVEIFAWLASRGLPVHPAYACSMGGMLERRHLRVAGIGGDRGTGFGRREWERRYYPEMCDAW